MPWAVVGAVALAGIVGHDNWTRIKPMLSGRTATVNRDARETAETRPAPKREAAAARQPVQTASAAQPVPPAAIPAVPVPAAQPARATAATVPVSQVSVSPATAQTARAAFGYCGQGEHINCVGDGGVFWYKGEKIVIADMVSPDIGRARCDDERRIAFAAKARLLTLLNAGPFAINAAGKTENGAAPRVVSRGGRSFGSQLITEGLAHKPGAPGGAWCA
jgi:endonuclease YncB( thermonuclease family)